MTDHRCSGCWASSTEKKLFKHGRGPLAFFACEDCADLVDRDPTPSGTPYQADLIAEGWDR